MSYRHIKVISLALIHEYSSTEVLGSVIRNQWRAFELYTKTEIQGFQSGSNNVSEPRHWRQWNINPT